MKRQLTSVITFGLFFLMFIQLAGTLIESIYILDLINISLDFKVLGVLFFFTPVLLLLFRKSVPVQTNWLLFGVVFLSRGIMPYLDTNGRLLASGIGTGAALLFLPLLVSTIKDDETGPGFGLQVSAGMALAVGLSALLRTLGFGVDYSLTSAGSWAGWVQGLALGWALARIPMEQRSLSSQPGKNGPTGAILGIFLVVTLVYLAVSAPTVIARWTGGSYAMIVGAVSLFSTGWAYLALAGPGFWGRITRGGLALWNGLFTISLVGTILAERVSFPALPSSPAVVISPPSCVQHIPLALMLLLFPVLYLDLQLFFTELAKEKTSIKRLIPGMLLGSLALVVLAFISVFTNVWGYISPVSTPFRNLFWLPFLLAAGALSLLVLQGDPVQASPANMLQGWIRIGWALLLGAIFLTSIAGAVLSDRPRPGDPHKASLLVMTYNVQAGNDAAGERSYDRQLAVIQKISPDLVALQETDTARIALNNDDLVRYFATKLGYFSYYGPTTVTGTFGTAILSKYPLQEPRVIFSFSDTDEIGTTEATIEVDGKQFSIFDVHPDGSDTAKLTFAQTLLQQSAGRENVIILGDFNMDDTQPAYRLVTAIYSEAWTRVYPSKIGPGGIDISGRIDHIFVSHGLGVRNPVYLLPPDSASDHPVHWAEVFWGE